LLKSERLELKKSANVMFEMAEQIYLTSSTIHPITKLY
jgi:hypothetical protein